MMDCPERRVEIQYTAAEWGILEDHAISRGGSDLQSFMYRSIHKLAGTIGDTDCPTERLIKSKKIFFIPPGISCEIMRIANALGIPPTTVIARMVTNPILQDHIESNGFSIIVR